METYKLSLETSSLFFMINGVTYLLLIKFIPRITDIFGTKLTILMGIISNSLCVLFLPPIAFLPHRVEIIILGLGLFGIPTMCIAIPGVFDIIYTLSAKGYDEDFANTIAPGVYALADAVGEIIGPTLGGYLTEEYDFNTSCVFVSIISLLYGFIFGLFTYRAALSFFREKETLLEKI
jgi:MFS family permease